MTHLDTPTARYLVGDVFDRMSELEDGSVDLVMTSPPFLALRNYLPADHPDKAKEIGTEATPAEFIDTLLRLTAEWGRLLAPHGSICVELGDTYAGSGGAGGGYGLRDGQPRFDGSVRAARSAEESRLGVDARNRGNTSRGTSAGGDWPLEKSLCGIPTLYAWSLAYGRNLLTGEPSPAGRWRIRNLVAWVRPNPPVGALGDKFRPATSYLTIATRARDRYFDLDAVRDKSKPPNRTPRAGKKEIANPDRRTNSQGTGDNPAGAPPLDWWEIPIQPYSGSHYATYPEALCIKPIEAMCPHRVCTTCGQPSRRIVEMTQRGTGRTTNGRKPRDRSESFAGATYDTRTVVAVETVGWSDCGHGTWRPGHVLDPFAGSGTTLAVAVGRGRAATGIDIDPRNADLARERLGMFLTVDDPRAEVAS